MPGPLDGVRILDLSAVVSGPLTTALLGDQGAAVIKVERLAGDIQRHVGSSRRGFSGMFHVLNRGKRSIAIDLKSPRGVAIVHELARRCDAAVQNFKPGVADRLGIGYDDLRVKNEKIVYLSISGFGPEGPNAGRGAYDPIIQVYSGMAAVQGRNRGRPEQVGQLILDKLTAATGCQAITAALFARERSGRGQHIQLSMLATAVSFLWPDAGSDEILLGDDVEHRPPIGAAGYLAQYADGWGCTMTLSDREFAGFCRAFEHPELANDPRFHTLTERMKHRDEFAEILKSTIADAARALTLDEAEDRFAREGVPFGRSRALEELPDDPQVIANELFRETEHPVAGRLREARPAPRFGETPLVPAEPAPTAGQHTREILDELGMAADIDALFAEGVVV
jgi:crotonobetainyl-CoA:carnitine CoA-transferase CaiB-like acyl-CoA transferase